MATLQALGSPEAAPPSLIKAIAVVEDPPAVVMERVEGDARDLAKPPTIVEVTRDRYAPGERFAATFALDALRGVAAALRHVHARRVAHGDVYGHNVLVAGGSVRLGDFGAASYRGPCRDLFGRGDAAAATWIVRGDESRRRRGRDVDSPQSRVAATPRPRRG